VLWLEWPEWLLLWLLLWLPRQHTGAANGANGRACAGAAVMHTAAAMRQTVRTAGISRNLFIVVQASRTESDSRVVATRARWP
jgi:hypothetical protein